MDSKKHESASRIDVRWETIFERSPVAMAELETDGTYIAANESLARLVGIGRGALEAQRLDQLIASDERTAFADWLAALPTPLEGEVAREVRLASQETGPVWLDIRLLGIPKIGGDEHALLAVFLDVSSQHELAAEVGFLLGHDRLTGLANRASAEDQLQLVLRELPTGSSTALIVIDIDDFRTLNEQFGTAFGDEALQSVARRLSERLRSSDVVARVGDDEFAVILPRADEQQAEVVAGSLIKDIHNLATVRADGALRQLNVSAGVAVSRTGSSTVGSLFKAAYDAAEDARRAGGGRSVVHAPQEDRSSRAHEDGSNIEVDRLVLLAQPILELSTGATDRYELFLRLREEDGTLTTAAEFLPRAVQHGRVGRIDRWVIEQAIHTVALHPDDTFRLHVNLSGRSLGDPFFMAHIQSEILNSRVDPSRIVFEVSEVEATTNIGFTSEFSRYLARLGCQFAVDRVGTGGGGLAYLADLPFDFLKIGGGLVDSFASSLGDRLVLEAIVSIAKGLSKRTIAGPVEDAGTLEQLVRAGVDYAQGYLIGRPEPLELVLPI